MPTGGPEVLLVTGGAGFIGSHLVARLVELGEPVRVLDNFSGGKRANLDGLLSKIELIDGDLRDEASVRAAVRDVHIVFHQAALPSVPRSIADPRTVFDVNVTGTLNLLLAARDAGCRRLIFASSSSVYGDTTGLPKIETMTPSPISPYAVSKLTGEHLCAAFTRAYGLESVSLRYFNVFGPRQDPDSPYAAVIPRLLTALRTGAEPVIFDDGEQSRDFTYVDNVVDANLRAAAADGAVGRVFNIASGRSVTVNTALRLLARLLGVEPRARHEPPRPGDIRDSLADIAAARKVLGFEVDVAFEEGLKRTVAEYAGAATVPNT
jgi:nucleoside-diphosphate-sugar epimerase